MSGFARENEVPFEITIERDAIGQEIAYAVPSFARDDVSHVLIDDAGAGADGVGSVCLRRIAFTNGCRDATLRPGARRALAEGGRGDERDWSRRELEGGEQAGEARADDDDIATSCWLICSSALDHGDATRAAAADRGTRGGSEILSW